jgi:hypothetical protein
MHLDGILFGSYRVINGTSHFGGPGAAMDTVAAPETGSGRAGLRGEVGE